MTARLRTIVLSAMLAATAADALARPTVPHAKVVLRTLDKVTARSHRIEVGVGETYTFGRIEITPRACLTAPPLDTPEAASFLEIRSVEHDETRTLVFEGWMFASSPGLSPMEHPVYDVWVLDCADGAS